MEATPREVWSKETSLASYIAAVRLYHMECRHACYFNASREPHLILLPAEL